MDKYFLTIYKTLNILCVEDEESVLQIYNSLFTPLFKTVHLARDGNEGFDAFEKEQIDIILTDNMMPKCSGLEMIRMIRQKDASIPIILITALESIEVLREAIALNVNSFLKKPFTSEGIFSAFERVAKTVIADKYIMQEQAEKILYSDYQENLTFKKEMTIIKDDTKNERELCGFECDVFYKPKDTLSGDSYSIRKINDDEHLLFVADGMGKGISASVSAMLSSAFVNYHVTQLQKIGATFSLQSLLTAFREFIGPNLLEDEVLSCSFFYCNRKSMGLEYAIFSMPPALYMHSDCEEVLKIKSNNIPFGPYIRNFQVDTLDISKLEKILIYSDGLNENTLDDGNESYAAYLRNDFQAARTFEELKEKAQACCDKQDDDITYIFFRR